MKTIRIYKFTVNGVGDREPITVAQECRRVTVREDPTVASWPTTDYNISDVASGGTYTHLKLGLSKVVAENLSGGIFRSGEIVGYIETSDADGTPSGSTTFERIEETW